MQNDAGNAAYMREEELTAAVAARIRAGELPSVVLRSILERSPSLTKSDLAPLLGNAFADYSVLHSVWNWRESAHSDAHDTLFNVRVMTELLRAGISLPWSEGYCESELHRIEPALCAEMEAERKASRDAVSYERLVEKIRGLDGRVTCIEARWDGDTRGWRIELAIILRKDDRFEEKHLGTVTFGTDFRLFRGTVPPWPEAQYAAEVGAKLAKTFRAEFYFPSPDTPNDDLPTWLEKNGNVEPSFIVTSLRKLIARIAKP